MRARSMLDQREYIALCVLTKQVAMEQPRQGVRVSTNASSGAATTVTPLTDRPARSAQQADLRIRAGGEGRLVYESMIIAAPQVPPSSRPSDPGIRYGQSGSSGFVPIDIQPLPPTPSDSGLGTSVPSESSSFPPSTAATTGSSRAQPRDTAAQSPRTPQICRVCLDAEMEIVFIPCGHMATCASCARNLQSCPICRTGIRACVRAFIV